MPRDTPRSALSQMIIIDSAIMYIRRRPNWNGSIQMPTAWNSAPATPYSPISASAVSSTLRWPQRTLAVISRNAENARNGLLKSLAAVSVTKAAASNTITSMI